MVSRIEEIFHCSYIVIAATLLQTCNVMYITCELFNFSNELRNPIKSLSILDEQRTVLIVIIATAD